VPRRERQRGVIVVSVGEFNMNDEIRGLKCGVARGSLWIGGRRKKERWNPSVLAPRAVGRTEYKSLGLSQGSSDREAHKRWIF